MSSNKIEISVKDIPEIIKTLEEAEKEIEFERKSKNLFIDDLYKVCEISLKQDKEIERLNNIINELEKWLEEDLKVVYRDAGHRHNLILEVLDKLQELKGSESNELQNKYAELEKLNKELDKAIIEFKKQIEEERKNYREIIGNFVDKIKELKGADKE